MRQNFEERVLPHDGHANDVLQVAQVGLAGRPGAALEEGWRRRCGDAPACAHAAGRPGGLPCGLLDSLGRRHHGGELRLQVHDVPPHPIRYRRQR